MSTRPSTGLARSIMYRLQRHVILLALFLTLSQWFSVVHAVEHIAKIDDSFCAICSLNQHHGQAIGSPGNKADNHFPVKSFPIRFAVADPVSATVCIHLIRAPPQSL